MESYRFRCITGVKDSNHNNNVHSDTDLTGNYFTGPSIAKPIPLWSPEDDKQLTQEDYFDIMQYLEQELRADLQREGILKESV